MMDRRRVAKNSRRRRKKNVDNTQQSKEPVYFPNDTILEAAKFLTYEKWSEMRFLCQRVNQLIQSNQSKLQAFEVRSLEMSDVRLRVDVRAFFDEPTEKSMPLIRGQAKRTGKAHKKNRYLPNAARSEPPKVFSAKFNDKYQFYGPILSHFFRLLHHPAVYFRKVSIFPPMTDKFCDITTHSPIRCDKFTLTNFDCSLEHSLKWLKDNVRAQQIILITNSDHFLSSEHHTLLSEFILQDASICAEDPSDLHSLVSEFILQNASICAQDRIILDWLPHPGKFVKALIKKYETLEVTKPIPSIVLEFRLGHVEIQLKCSELNLEDYEYPKFFMPDLEPIRYPPLYDKRCGRCNIKTYEQPIKSDGGRKMIVQFRRCFKRDCLHGDYAVYVRFQ
ncbi:hypothetical protein DdX_15826 [Ditylenchus destructor]|uniref:Uncharacterized protein n=1 Tax=Ditylenchus destructor TaxID=166010 RepID=A0AAD4QUE4_9BILA|nr:hypothetical protein DdX_15826 [Ditylenchus destructor]